MKVALAILFSIFGLCLAARHELLPYNPVANPDAVIISGNARFTVLTASLIRIEYSTTGLYYDNSKPPTSTTPRIYSLYSLVRHQVILSEYFCLDH